MNWPELWQWVEQNSWVGTVFFIVFASLLLRLVIKFVFDRLERTVKHTRNLYDDTLIKVARKPVGWTILFYGIVWAATIVRENTAAGVLEYLDQIQEVGTIALLVWFAFSFIRETTKRVVENHSDQNDRSTIEAVGKLLRVSVLITGFLIALQTLGFSIEGVLAFGGIGGIAVGFAARDMLANFFGTVSLLLDKPFAEGDWIRSDQMEIEGTVEEIGWRITRIRTFDKRPLYVPNSNFTNITIENPSRMTNRRIKETFSVRYRDMLVLPVVLEDIRTMLREHEEIDTNQILMVNLNELTETTVDFFIYTFTKTTDWAFFHEIKEDVLLKIEGIIRSHGAEMRPPQAVNLITNPALDTVAA